MKAFIEKINRLDFTEDALKDALEASYKLGAAELEKEGRALLSYDLDFFDKKGRWLIHNTFVGGIIFLREPETINRIEILCCSNLATVSVEYDAPRNALNVKHKPDAGKIENTTWNMELIFPNFIKHQTIAKVLLMAIIGKITKHLCEHHRKNSWLMRFEKPFDIELFLEGRLELAYRVDI